MPERTNSHPSGRSRSAIGHRFGTRQLRELLAARGDAGLWLAEDDDGAHTLVRLYPALPTLEEWHALDLAASQLAYVVDPRLVPIDEIALDVWPRLSFACADAEPLVRRIAREPMAPAAALTMCADVAAALAALERSGVPAVDVSPADIVLVDGRARLLADVGLPGGKVAHACIDLDHVAPERAAVIADRARGVRAARGAGSPTAESMTYALASIAAAAVYGSQPAAAAPEGERAAPPPPARLEQVLRRGLAQSPAERYARPAALVAALAEAIGIDLAPSGESAPRARSAHARGDRARSAQAAVAPERGDRAAGARPQRRRVGVAIPVAVALVAATLGIAAGLGTTAPEPPATPTLSGAGLSVDAPRGWLRGTTGEGPAAIGAPALVAHLPGPTRGTALVVTREAEPLLARLAEAAPEPVRLGEHDAWRYPAVAVDDESVADVYVLADSVGAIVAACLGPSDAPASVREPCAAALTTLRLDAGRTAALGGGAAARRELAGVVEDLGRARARERRALADAATGRGQAAAADRLAAAYARAAAGAGRAGTVGAPGDLPRLVERLEETGRAYGALAAAARATRRTAYAQARERVVAHEHELREDLSALAAARSSS